MSVTAAGTSFDVEAIVFDKDGTLVSLESYWLEPARLWIETAASGSAELGEVLGERLGLSAGRLAPDGLLATATLSDLTAQTEQVLREAGVSDTHARNRAMTARGAAAQLSAVQPLTSLGDVRGALSALAAGGLRLAVATTDDRGPTLDALARLGIDELIEFVVAADDEIPAKPHPAVLETIAAAFEMPTSSLLMVGDSQRDADASRAAGAAGFVLVSAGGYRPEIQADAVVTSIEELRADMPTTL
jgi:phosphoglycolate phosphatase